MGNYSRMDRLTELISDFIVNDSKQTISLELYSSEIKRIKNRISDGNWELSISEINNNPRTHLRTVKFSKI